MEAAVRDPLSGEAGGELRMMLGTMGEAVTGAS